MISLPRQFTLRTWAVIVMIVAVALTLPRVVWILVGGVVGGLYLFFGMFSTALMIVKMPSLAIASAALLRSEPRGTAWRDRIWRTAPLWPSMRLGLLMIAINSPLYLRVAWVSIIGP